MSLQRLAIAPTQLQNEQVSLSASQQHYLRRVLRLQTGDRIILLNGQGQAWLAALQEGATATILEPYILQTELPLDVSLILALPKNGFDDVVRACTELGVSCMIPVISDRSLLKPSPQKLERWRRIATEAAEQSERQTIPPILEPIPFAKSLASSPDARSFIAVARGTWPHLLTAVAADSSPSAIQIAIGPEGGWSAAEVEMAIATGFQPVTLGSRILRAITAPIVALSLVTGVLESQQARE
ncbi:16S rRNA (uracil(1498)-N(3))-methyltransferase [Desertifilum sp. FACHB-1129]|uniref:Ribosomal RNA small subunit methyltransferase E n=1 Tax=Desertifilum tharense IPPAS B-1220 TaxID=1781255 RepID=A0A1E5QPH1_9CYAN|nr:MULTISPECIES: 16S rRNA (uracil(1498)-N(3))-methyltransferase [Desertifilum]MDA0212231.1 16S rRNA (uracil(1498)-N(3))-methyltransferase [Cyanobacteria bacterium FC1]MBD2312810.1 16S rRNA (uracil(1498)-N(3))-methyltransferase [Desertifilum sp. FACHB-1129]MBD2324174.1 16S rRNA (uracil(1498)-N(3))-methyltransferase [Desertifilum sp. FACHB-866]MBD2334188.1 16S rRNA (uracil(1498)-N(3))-methyltransferase [Desertifilum sp. FACHB-868]OEJ76253.1 16S rRNA (uracil(1498)-N(3))-methyltransferase [Deserti